MITTMIRPAGARMFALLGVQNFWTGIETTDGFLALDDYICSGVGRLAAPLAVVYGARRIARPEGPGCRAKRRLGIREMGRTSGKCSRAQRSRCCPTFAIRMPQVPQGFQLFCLSR